MILTTEQRIIQAVTADGIIAAQPVRGTHMRIGDRVVPAKTADGKNILLHARRMEFAPYNSIPPVGIGERGIQAKTADAATVLMRPFLWAEPYTWGRYAVGSGIHHQYGRAVQMAIGQEHGLLINEAGECWAWGSNNFGQLGDGTTTNRFNNDMTQVAGGHTFVAIAAGARYSLGITDNGDMYAWGYNSYGNLGNGTSFTVELSPVLVSGGHSWTQVSAGLVTTLAIDDSGNAWGWGYNTNGAIGDGSTTDSDVPVAVSGGHTWIKVAAGHGHSAGITDSGAAYAWGSNSRGQIGDGTNTDSTVPVAVSGGHTWTDIDVGMENTIFQAFNGHTAAIDANGAAYAWGYNGYGQLGDGTTSNRNTPGAVNGGHTCTAIAAGSAHTVMLDNKMQIQATGNNSYGQLGDGTTTQRIEPVLVQGNRCWLQCVAYDQMTGGIADI
jgi:alpha-tubulin suppressor-like RCC1 family protein